MLVLAGCSASSSGSAEALTAAEWRRQANAICRDIGRQARAVPHPTTLDGILPFTTAVTPLWKQEEDRVRALVPPDELAAGAEALGDALAEVNVALPELHIARQRGEARRHDDAVRRSETASQSVRLRSQEFGLAACAAQRVPRPATALGRPHARGRAQSQ